MIRCDRGAAVVVGDKFEGFASLDGVQTVSQLLRTAHGNPSTLPEHVIAGQGIGDFELAALSTAIDQSGRRPRPRIHADAMALASRSASHKRRPQNVLLANIVPSGTRAVRADLRIDNDNELLLDHQTGQHVQGMVVVEASRQMFLASTTALGLIADLKDPYFVIESMATEFRSFLFPLPARLRFTTTAEPDRSHEDSFRFEAVIEIEQHGVSISATRVAYRVFAGASIHEIERRKARKALGALSLGLVEQGARA